MNQTTRDRRFRRWLVGCGLLAATCFFYGCSDRSPDPSDTASIRGTAAAAFELPDLEGGTVQLQDFQGKVVLLNFWGTTCAPCLTEIPWLVEFQKQYGTQGLQVVAVSMYGEGLDVLKPYVAEHGMENLKVLVGNKQVGTSFDVAAFPTTFLVDREGKYVSRHNGLINRAGVESELAVLLK